MSPHTPGPWKWNESGTEDARVFIGDSAIGGVYRGGDSDLLCHADARLIAAAPDLYSALKSAVSEMRREHDAGDGHFSTAEVEAAEAAIRKVEGE